MLVTGIHLILTTNQPWVGVCHDQWFKTICERPLALPPLKIALTVDTNTSDLLPAKLSLKGVRNSGVQHYCIIAAQSMIEAHYQKE